MEVRLNKVQNQAVNQTQGSVLVLAGAGSGKTRVLTHRVAKLIDDGIYPSNILALTFTNKAANEMKERISLLRENVANQMWIGTFHSICLKILIVNIEKIGYKPGFTIYDSDDALALVKRIFKNCIYADSGDFNVKTIRYNISSAKNHGYTPVDYLTQFDDFDPKETEHLATSCVFEEYEKQLKLDNALDFDDLLLKTILLFKQDKETLNFYQRKFQYIHVDEYQDTNEIQYQLVKMLSAFHKNIFVVGDDDQSIYGWRGANIQNIFNFEKDFPNTKTFKLEQNYRSHQKILDLSNAVINNNTSRKQKVLYSDTKAGIIPMLYVFSTEYAESKGIATICKHLQSQDENLNDIAIMYRTNAQSRLIEQALLEQNIPSKNLSGRSFYERREIKDILSYLNLMVNKDADACLLRAINTPKRKIGNTSIAKLTDFSQNQNISLYSTLEFADNIVTKTAASSIKIFKTMMDDFVKQKDLLPLNELLDYIFIGSGLKNMYQRTETMAEAAARIENVEELVKNAAERELQGETLEDFLYNISLVTNMEREQNAQAISLMTMHSAKGLEYKNVIIAGVINGVIPHTFSANTTKGIEEERRLLYVGITRAQQRLYMTSYTAKSTRQNGFYEMTLATVSTFIREVSEDLYTETVSNEANQTMENVGISKPSALKKVPFKDFAKPNFAQSSLKDAPKVNQDINYQIDDKVLHPKFGSGVVKKISGQGDGIILTIEFESGQTKKIFASIVPLEKL